METVRLFRTGLGRGRISLEVHEMACYRFCFPLRLARTPDPLAPVVILNDCYPGHTAYYAQCASHVPHTSSSSPMLKQVQEIDAYELIDSRHILVPSIYESYV